MLIVLGDYYLKLGQTKTAIESYEKALALAGKTRQSEIAAASLLGLGNGYRAQRDFNRAVEYHRKAADAYHNLNNAQCEAISLERAGQRLL